MKYSIRGNIKIEDTNSVILIINKYPIWRLYTSTTRNDENNEEVFSFEVWVNTEKDKNGLFNELKPLVDDFGEVIDWHRCSHDEEISVPCVIEEEYRGG